jgi:hypothetical protein
LVPSKRGLVDMTWPSERPSDEIKENALRICARRGDVITPLVWEPARTAVIICDMWDDHWCKRAALLAAGTSRERIRSSRARGGVTVHAPSDTMKFYSGLQQRTRAEATPLVNAPIPIKMRGIDLSREPELPIDEPMVVLTIFRLPISTLGAFLDAPTSGHSDRAAGHHQRCWRGNLPHFHTGRNHEHFHDGCTHKQNASWRVP